ncbi:S8 family serine peptidase [Bacillaceae bacterium C204]|uniref:S8 family serine peptidase n=1 Tax=Neobacillus sp. 204 TaxID=3383351 RepID=UPI00397E5F38
MSKRMRQKKRMLSISMLIAMLLNFALPQSLTFVQAAENPSQKSPSSETFNAKEVNRILDGLTPEQKANINKLTGAENSQKIHVEPKDLRSSKNINVIVQFKVDPAKVQIIKKSLAKGGASLNSQAFAGEYSDAQKKVKDSHATFKSFVNNQLKTQMMNNQPKTKIVGGQKEPSTMSIKREYSDAFNGVALSLPANLVSTLAENSEIASVWPVEKVEAPEELRNSAQATETNGFVGNSTPGLSFLGIDKLQAAGHTGIIKSGPRAGQKIKVGVLDTGIDYNHPDLKAVYKGGHDFANYTVDVDGNITFVDDLDPMETVYTDWVNAKSNPDPLAGPPPTDYKQYITSHGTHVSGTIAANTTNNNATYSANGVAPNVDLYGYRVLGPGGHGTSDSVLNGIDQATKDHMDVINLSLGASINDPLYPTSIAINNATLQGVVCAVAAGNSGPGQATVGSPGTSALAITVGASTFPENIPVMTLKNGSNPYQARLFGKNFAQADDAYKGQTLPIVDVGLGSAADYIGKDMSGKIALVHRGVEFLQTKMANAHNAHAAGMIIWNNNDDAATQGYIQTFLGVSIDNVYSVSLTQAQGQALSDAITKDPNNATITFPTTLDAPINKNGDELANFSSAGPVRDWTIKPDVVAPGVDISSTAPYDIWEPQDNTTHDYKYGYQIMSGTSMATPHVAGIIALVLAAHPDYSPADVKTSLMNTAKDINTDSKTYSVYQVGAGRVDPTRAINADVKIQVLDKTNTYDTDPSTIHQVDNITGSISFGFKGRGEGATNGSDDVIQSKDFNVSNQGASSKTFNVSTKFITSKFVGSNPVGPGTGNDVKIDFTAGGTNVTSLNVDGGSTVKATASITVPSNSLEGTYEGYIYLVNAADSTESYRIPFTITVAEKGIDFEVIAKSFTLPTSITGNYNIDTPYETSLAYYSVNGTMKNLFIVLKDKDGKYLGVAQTLVGASEINPGVMYSILLLTGGKYLPFTKPFNGNYDPSGLASQAKVMTEGAYSLEMITTDETGKKFTAEDTVYVDTTKPVMTMAPDSQPGIYELDPTGYQPGQEIKGFYGKVFDSNIDVMKNNGDTSIISPKDGKTPVPVDQGLNHVWGYQDNSYPTAIFDTDAEGRFHFGVTAEDLQSKMGSQFWIYPSDYSGAADVESTNQTYYFIKKGTPYLTYTNSDGVDAGPGSEGKLVVDDHKAFKTTIATKNGVGMTGGKFTFTGEGSSIYSYSNVKLTEEYKNYLISRGIDPTNILKVQYYGTEANVTISGISEAGALDKDMNILEANVTYTSDSTVTGPLGYFLHTSLTLSGTDTQVAAFPTNVPSVRQSKSTVRGRMAAESFSTYSVGSSYGRTPVASGAKVTLINSSGATFKTDEPTTPSNTVDYQFIQPNYAVTANLSNEPYKMETYMPGHFKGYATTPVIGTNKYGYHSGAIYDMPNVIPVLLAGDVNGDNVIDMLDLLAEVQTYADFNFLKQAADNPATEKAAFLNTHRDQDISWTSTNGDINYNDFYYIFKNFGKVNQSAIVAGITVPTPQLTLPSDVTIKSDKGKYIPPTYPDSVYDTVVQTFNLKNGDGLEEIRKALNFAGPGQTPVGTLPTLPELKNGASISIQPSHPVMIDDVVWRKAIQKVLIGTTDVTSNVTIAAGYVSVNPANGAMIYVPSKITLPGSLFTTVGNPVVTITATGYKDVKVSLSIKDIPIVTPTISLVTDPAKAHIGQDLTLDFTDDANWRNGIDKIVVKHSNWTPGVDITNLINPATGNKYYDISQPGKITFNKDLFKTNTSPATATAAINPGGTNWLPQQYMFEIDSIGADSTVYPKKTVGLDASGTAGQAVGYGVTFDTQGGAPIAPIAIGYQPGKTKIQYFDPVLGISRFDYITNSVGTFINPTPIRPGYKFIAWYTDPACTILWDPRYPVPVSADVKVYGKWKMAFTQNYSPVDKTKPNGLKFDGTNGSISGIGSVLGEEDLKITFPDYLANIPWLTGKDNISKIEATYYKINSDGNSASAPTTYTLDPSTYNLLPNPDGSGTLTFTTATESYANAHPTEKFAFSAAPSILTAIKGYKITITAKSGETAEFTDVRLGYRRHIDLNGGTLTSPTDLYFADTLVNGKAAAPNMVPASSHISKGIQGVGPYLYLDSAGTKEQFAPINNGPVMLTDNATYYLSWIKTPPTVSKDKVGNTVGSDITLTFTDDGTWKNNIKEVWIGSKQLVANIDYTITDGAITLNHSLFTAGQKVNVVIKSENYMDALVSDQVIGYLVTFESNGSDSIAAQIVDRSVTKPADPTKIGYKFYGWYTDKELTTLYDFDNIVTKPMTLYAKYALAGSLVSPDSTNNSVGNDMTLEFSDSDWAKAIAGITVNGSSVDGTKYKVDTASQTITLDKSLFTKVRDFTISISAKDYADVTVIQKVVNGYNVHFVLPSDAPFEVQDQNVSRRITPPVVYGYDLTWFADEACTIPWDFTNSIYSAKTIYGKWSLHKFTVIFDKQDGGLVESKTADYTTKITAPTAPTRTGYTFLGWYKDAAGKTAWNFATDKVEGDVILYAKWATGVENNGLYNKDVTITFNEATATLDGKAFTSGTKITSEGDHTLVVTDAAGNAKTIKFTIDKTAPTVVGVVNNGFYNKNVTLSFNELGGLLNGTPVPSGTIVKKEGTYTLVVTDAAGNVTTVKFTIDKTAPQAPIVKKVTSTTTLVTGTAEPGTKIYVRIGTKIIGTGIVDKYGNFAVSIDKQKVGSSLYVTAEDEAGNESDATKVTVSK